MKRQTKIKQQVKCKILSHFVLKQTSILSLFLKETPNSAILCVSLPDSFSRQLLGYTMNTACTVCLKHIQFTEDHNVQMLPAGRALGNGCGMIYTTDTS